MKKTLALLLILSITLISLISCVDWVNRDNGNEGGNQGGSEGGSENNGEGAIPGVDIPGSGDSYYDPEGWTSTN